MHANTAISAAALLALAHRALALGSANVKNMCSYPVYLESVSQQAGSMQTLAANGGTWSESWQINGDGGGLSIKMSRDQSMAGHITQFEYTLAQGLWYDISNINGWPFEGEGLTVVPSDSSCRSILCPSNSVCASAYNKPDDNQATAFCSEDSSMDIVLCSANEGSGSSSSAQAAPAPPKPSPAPQEEAAPTPTITQAPTSPVAIATTVAVHTTLVTQVVTLEVGPDGSAMFEINKRDTAHPHDHRNAHRGNHARSHRHVAEQQ